MALSSRSSTGSRDVVFEGPLFVEASGIWEDMYCEVLNTSILQCREKLSAGKVASRDNCGDVIVVFSLPLGQIEVKKFSLTLPALSSIMQLSQLPSTPYFFQVENTFENIHCNLAACSDDDRSRWMRALNNMGDLLRSESFRLSLQQQFSGGGDGDGDSMGGLLPPRNQRAKKPLPPATYSAGSKKSGSLTPLDKKQQFIHTSLVEGLIVDQAKSTNRFMNNSPIKKSSGGVAEGEDSLSAPKKGQHIRLVKVSSAARPEDLYLHDGSYDIYPNKDPFDFTYEQSRDTSNSRGGAIASANHNSSARRSRGHTAAPPPPPDDNSVSSAKSSHSKTSRKSSSSNKQNNNGSINNSDNNNSSSNIDNEGAASAPNKDKKPSAFGNFFKDISDHINAVISPKSSTDDFSDDLPKGGDNQLVKRDGDAVKRGGKLRSELVLDAELDDDDDDDQKKKENSLKKKWVNISRLFEVTSVFPFVIVSASLSGTNRFLFLKSITIVRIMNLMIYILPILLVSFILSRFPSFWIQVVTIACYLFLYLAPVGFVSFIKMKNASNSATIEDGTFCFKPSSHVRWTQSNFWAFFTIFFEWGQHTFYVLPTTVSFKDKVTLLKDQPPYVSFEVWFWTTVSLCVLCALLLILNTALTGKAHHKFTTNESVWFLLYNVGTPMYITFITILFMGLYCDYSVEPAVLVQDPTIVCYSERHLPIARASLISLAMYLVQNTLLPTGTFKETMGDGEADVMFVPVYLQMHFLIKAIFCGIYVFFYTNNWVRCTALTVCNILLLIVNNYMKPCSVYWINIMRDAMFMHASLSGIQSINYLAWPPNDSTRWIVITTLASNIFFVSVTMALYVKFTAKSVDYRIANTFLDLEWQVSRGGANVDSRVLEPLISLSLSSQKSDWDVAKKYIKQLIQLVDYPNMRVQFQSTWALANLALCNDECRIEIRNNKGVEKMFACYEGMPFLVQLETLAALTNLTLTSSIVDEMVENYDGIRFFINIAGADKMKHSQFACIAIANVAKKDEYRDLIAVAGGIQVLIGGLMSSDYYKRRYACLALANVALSNSKEILTVFDSKAIIDRVIKMAMRKEVETQKEVVALIRNLSCHSRLRPILLQRGIMDAVHLCKDSVFPEVTEWCADVIELMQREIQISKQQISNAGQSTDYHSKKNTPDSDLLARMAPLSGQVEWSTWGSKLESMFAIIFAYVPALKASNIIVYVNQSVTVDLANGVDASQKKEIKDKATYTIIQRPQHGLLGNPANNGITYTPHRNFVGVDMFTYRMNISGGSTWPTTVSITISSDSKYFLQLNTNNSTATKGNNNNSININNSSNNNNNSSSNNNSARLKDEVGTKKSNNK